MFVVFRLFQSFLNVMLALLQVNMEPDVLTVGASESLQQMVSPLKVQLHLMHLSNEYESRLMLLFS